MARGTLEKGPRAAVTGMCSTDFAIAGTWARKLRESSPVGGTKTLSFKVPLG